MLILIVDALTCICSISDIPLLIRCFRDHLLITVSANTCFLLLRVVFFLFCTPATSHLSSLPIPVKSKCWMERMSTTNYCQLWTPSQTKYATAPPPTLSSGPLVSQSWALQPCQPVRQTQQTCRQTLQRTCSVLDVLWCEEWACSSSAE